MAKLYNLARMTTSTTGSGAIALGSAVTGFLSFVTAGVQDGDEISYGLKDGDNHEVGRGIYSASGSTLTRSLLNSTTGSLLNLSGIADAYISALAEDIGNVGNSASATDGHLAIFDGVTGKIIKDGGALPLGGDSTFTDVYASRPAAGNDGDVFLPSDGFSLQRDTGAAWIPWGPLFKFIEPPAVGDFTWGNQGSATATKLKGGIYITDTSDSNVNRILYKAAPTAPFTVTIGFLINSLGITNEAGGMLLRQSSDGKQVTFCDLVNAGMKIAITKWSDHTSWVGSYKESAVNLAICYANPLFLRYYDDGTTNRVFSISRDGQNFLTFLTQSRTDYLTIDQIGFYIGMNGAGSSVGMTLLHWVVT